MRSRSENQRRRLAFEDQDQWCDGVEDALKGLKVLRFQCTDGTSKDEIGNEWKVTKPYGAVANKSLKDMKYLQCRNCLCDVTREAKKCPSCMPLNISHDYGRRFGLPDFWKEHTDKDGNTFYKSKNNTIMNLEDTSIWKKQSLNNLFSFNAEGRVYLRCIRPGLYFDGKYVNIPLRDLKFSHYNGKTREFEWCYFNSGYYPQLKEAIQQVKARRN